MPKPKNEQLNRILLASPEATRISIAKMERITGLERHIVKYRIQQLLREGRIRPTVLMDSRLLGHPHLVEIQATPPRMAVPGAHKDFVDRLCRHLCRHPTPLCLTTSEGRIVALTLADPDQLAHELRDIFSLSPGEFKITSQIHLHTSLEVEPNRRYLHE